jgi:hypothetical protein
MLQFTSENVEKVKNAQNTQIIDDFPHNISRITKMIDQFANNNIDTSRKILICTDVVGYGVLSNNKDYSQYFEKLHEIAGKRNNIDIEWHFYNAELQKNQSIEQFEAFIPKVNESKEKIQIKEKRFAEYIENVKREVKEPCQPCEKDRSGKCKTGGDIECNLIKSIDDKNPDALAGILNKLERRQKEKLSLTNQIKNGELKQKLPFFAWFFVFNNNDNEKIDEAVISYPAYFEGSNEKSFKTSEEKLTRMFYNIIKDFIKVNSSLNK